MKFRTRDLLSVGSKASNEERFGLSQRLQQLTQRRLHDEERSQNLTSFSRETC